MRLAGHAFSSVAEGGAAIVVPGHLKYVRVGFHAFDPQTRAEWPVPGHQVRHEGVLDHLAEGIPLLGRQALPVLLETRQRLERRATSPAGRFAEGGGIWAGVPDFEPGSDSGRDVLVITDSVISGNTTSLSTDLPAVFGGQVQNLVANAGGVIVADARRRLR